MIRRRFESLLRALPGRRKTSAGPVALSVSVITKNSATRLEALIAHARGFAQEVVVGVDADSDDATWDVAAQFADAAYRFRHPNQLAPAHMLPFEYCRGRWILRLDDDELMEDGFDALVPELLATSSFTHFSFARKWVVSLDPPEYIHEIPWYPNWQPRLMRNDASLVWKPPRYHSGYLVAGPGAQETRCAILHYEPIVCSPGARAEKVRAYREGGGDGVAEDEYAEKIGERRAFVPPRVSSATRPPVQRIDSSIRRLEVARLPPWGCCILSIDHPARVVASRRVVVTLRLENTGRMTWVPFQRTGWPALTVGLHVKSATGEMIERNGPRIELRSIVAPGQSAEVIGFFTAPAGPGEYRLAWDMVSEHECWFEECGSVPPETSLVVVSAEESPGTVLSKGDPAATPGASEPFFVVGCPRSGTTLLSVILDRHSRVAVPPETAFFDEIAPNLVRGDDDGLRESLRGWQRLVELKLAPEAVVQRVTGREWAPADVLSAILQLYAEARGKARIGEKTPQHLPHVSTIMRSFPGSRVVCLLRDGRDAALSLCAMPWWRPNGLAAAAELWVRSAHLLESFAQRYSDRFMVVRYEALVADPRAVVSSVMQFLGESFEPGQLSPEVPSDVVLPRSMEWKERALGPVEADASRPNRRELASPDDLALLERLMGSELRRHGY